MLTDNIGKMGSANVRGWENVHNLMFLKTKSVMLTKVAFDQSKNIHFEL